MRALARAIDAKDHSTQLHSERVASLAKRLGDVLGWSPERLAALHEAALIHDVGKIGVADAVLLKPGRLEPDEYEAVKAHVALGALMAAEVLSDEQTTWVREHHERYDGAGYPDGLAGDAISDGAQILAVADSWDVMTSDRPYAPRMPVTNALKECQRCVGHQFAPDVVEALKSPGFERILRIFANEQNARHGNEILLHGGLEALEALRRDRRIGLVISDIQMPGMDGLELLATIRADLERASLPVVLVTSLGSDDHRRRGAAAGADAYIVKQNFDQRALLEQVDGLLGR